MTRWLDADWVDQELIPLLEHVFHEYEYDRKLWSAKVRESVSYIDIIPVYEDFDSTIERLRLVLMNPGVMTQAEIMDAGWLFDCVELCICIFVRHQIRHGTYPLASLGCEPSPDHPRNEPDKLSEKLEYIYGGKLAANRRDAEAGPEQWKLAARKHLRHKPKQSARRPQIRKWGGITALSPSLASRSIAGFPDQYQDGHGGARRAGHVSEDLVHTNHHSHSHLNPGAYPFIAVSGFGAPADDRTPLLGDTMAYRASENNSPALSGYHTGSNVSDVDKDENLSLTIASSSARHISGLPLPESKPVSRASKDALNGGAIEFQPGVGVHRLS